MVDLTEFEKDYGFPGVICVHYSGSDYNGDMLEQFRNWSIVH